MVGFFINTMKTKFSSKFCLLTTKLFINASLQITRKQREVVEIFSLFSCLYVPRLYNK